MTGKPMQVSRTVHVDTKTQAAAKLRQFIDEVGTESPGTKATVAELWKAYRAHLERTGKAPTTLGNYDQAAKLYLLPALGKVELGELRAIHLDRYYGSLTERGLSDGTVRIHHTLLSGALRQAVKWEWVPRNVATSATPPKATRSRRTAPTPEEVRQLIAAAEGDIDLGALIALAAITGARRGELCGLRWPDVDWSAGAITISRALVPGPGGDLERPTKTDEPRKVAVGSTGTAVLRAYQQAQRTRCDAMRVEPDPDGWLLSKDGGHHPLKAKAVTEAVRVLGRRAGVDITMHQLRHYAASQLIGGGVDVRTAAGRLGHSPQLLLKTYAHVLPERDRAAAEMLEAAVLTLPAGD